MQKGILFLHGFLGDSSDWDCVVQEFSPNHCCLAIDLPSATFPDAAKYIVDRVQASGISDWTIVGYSMGGRLALYLALRFPHVFSNAILISASPGLGSADERQKRRESDERLAQGLEQHGLERFLFSWYEQPLFRPLRQSPNFPALFLKRKNGDAQQLAQSLRLMGTGMQPSLWEELASCKIPVHFISGELDRKFVDLSREMMLLCPDSSSTIVLGSGHAVHLEKPEALLRCMKQLLSC